MHPRKVKEKPFLRKIARMWASWITIYDAAIHIWGIVSAVWLLFDSVKCIYLLGALLTIQPGGRAYSLFQCTSFLNGLCLCPMRPTAPISDYNARVLYKAFLMLKYSYRIIPNDHMCYGLVYRRPRWWRLRCTEQSTVLVFVHILIHWYL